MIAGIKLYLGLAKVAAVALLLLAVAWWWGRHNAEQQDIGYRRAAAEYAAQLVAAQEEARQRERKMMERWEEAQNARIQTEITLDRARAVAAAADRRLQQSAADFGQRLSSATAEACRAAATTAAALLGECSAAYRELAAAADGHAADVGAVMAAWPGE